MFVDQNVNLANYEPRKIDRSQPLFVDGSNLVPPPPSEVPKALSDWERFLHDNQKLRS